MFVCVCCGMCLPLFMHFFGRDSLYIGPHMNFSDCVLNFIFFMCSLVVTMKIHYY